MTTALYSKEYYHRGNKYSATRKAYQELNRQRYRDRNNKRNKEVKEIVISHYGVNGVAQCCYPGCQINDIDMLTIDHIHNDGSEHRKELSNKSGSNLYRWIVKNGFPNDRFQTLCFNHQIKKAIETARSRRLRTLNNENIH